MDKRVELYDIASEYAGSYAALMACETDQEYDEALAMLDAVVADLNVKGTEKAKILRSMTVRHAVQMELARKVAAEAERLFARAKSTDTAIHRLKESVYFAMESNGLERIRTDIGTWYIGKSLSCTVTDPAKVPEEFIKAYTPEIDKAAAKKHYEFTGELIDGLEFTHGRTANFR